MVVAEAFGVDGGVGCSAHLHTGHQVYLVPLGEVAGVFGLCFPGVLRHIAVPVLDDTSLGHIRNAVHTRLERVFTGEIGVFLGHFLGHRVIDLQAELGEDAQSLHRLVVEIEDGLHRPRFEHILRAGPLFEEIEVQHIVVIALIYAHVGVVDIAAVGIVGVQIGVHRAGVLRRVGENVRIREVGAVFVLSYEHRGAEAQVFQQVVVGFHREIQTLESRSDGCSLFVVVAAREIVAGLVAAARDAEAVLLVERHLINLLAPVGAVLAQGIDGGLRFGRKRCEAAFSKRSPFVGLVQNAGYAAHVLPVVEPSVGGQCQFEIDLLRGVHQVQFVEVGTVGHEERRRNVDARGLVAAAFLGGDDDDAVGCAGSVDGRRRGVFQHGDVLDVGRVETRDRHVVEIIDVLFRRPVRGDVVAFERHAVQHPQRVGVAVQRHRTADLDLAGSARGARRGGRGQTCDRAREHFIDARHAVAGDVRHLDIGDRRSQLALLDALIAGHHDGVHLAFRRREVDRKVAFSRDVDGLCLVAEVADHDFLDAHGQFESETPLFVDDGSLRVVVLGLSLFGRDEDGGAYQRRTVGAVEDLAGDLPGLLGQCQQRTDQDE